jgi:hypothetical protein
MAFLEKFSADEKEMLVSLPYRAGLWVSRADDAGAPEAGDKEAVTLEKIIIEKSRGMFESAFAHEVMAEICGRRGDWPRWGDSVDDVPATCEKARTAIAAKLGDHDLDGYRQNIMAIAVAVAEAFREFDFTTPLPARIMTYMKLALDRLIGKLSGQEYESNDILNVSYKEDVALAALAKSLGLDGSSIEDDLAPEKKT